MIYDLLFKTEAKDHAPKHLGARIGITAILHTWGSPVTEHDEHAPDARVRVDDTIEGA